MFFGCIFCVYSIKFPFCLVIGSPPPILAIYGNLFLWFIEYPWFKIVKSLNITLVGVTYFFLVRIWFLLLPPPLTVASTEVLFLYNLDRRLVSARILEYLGSLLVRSFDYTMFLYFSLAFWMSYYSGTYLSVSQSYLVLSMKVEIVPYNIDENYWVITFFYKIWSFTLPFGELCIILITPNFYNILYTYPFNNILYLGEPSGNIIWNYHGTFIYILMK